METITIPSEVLEASTLDVFIFESLPKKWKEQLIFLFFEYDDYYICADLNEYNIVRNSYDKIKKYVVEYLDKDEYVRFSYMFSKESLEEVKDNITHNIDDLLSKERENVESYILNDIGNSLKEKEKMKKRVIKRLVKEEYNLKNYLLEYIHNEKDKIEKHLIEFIDNDELRK